MDVGSRAAVIKELDKVLADLRRLRNMRMDPMITGLVNRMTRLVRVLRTVVSQTEGAKK